MVRRFYIVMLALPAPLAAQSPPAAPPPEIRVSGVGTVETAPDLAVLALSLRGEGATPDDANRQLAARQQALVAGLRSIDPALDLRTETVRLNEIRTGDCGDDDDDDSMSTVAAALDGKNSKGPCRVSGYRTSLEGQVRTTRVADAGTMVGLAGRLGAIGVRISDFTLRDPKAAMRRATAAAMDDARARAQLIAEAGKARLGPIREVSDPDARGALEGEDVVVMYDVAAPAVMPPPVAIAVSPGPVRTQARLIVSFALLP